MILLYAPCKGREEAEKISRRLLSKKLAACTNIFPIKSIYLWKGKLTKDNETVMLVKTTERLAKKAKEEIIKLHSYDVPCIISIKGKANKEYEKWLREAVK